MLYEVFKNSEVEKNINKKWAEFGYKNGHKEINVDNFLSLNYSWCRYTVNKKYYAGYFSQKEINLIFEVLDYNQGRIRTLNG